MNLIFDLDGTLIDSRLRLYNLFIHLVPTSNLCFDEYWRLKRSKVSNETILSSRLGFNSDQICQFVDEWMAKIESPQYLEFDKVFPGTEDALRRLSDNGDLFVCTARQKFGAAYEQLKSLGLISFFSEVLVTEQCSSKVDLIRRSIGNLSQRDWIIGDTGKDVQTGKDLGIRTCAVLSGFLNRRVLDEYLPDLILDSIADFTP